VPCILVVAFFAKKTFREEQAVAIRSVAIPLLSGGAVLLGYTAFSWLRKKGSTQELRGPTTLREAGLTAERGESEAPESDVGPLSERSPEYLEVLELDLDFEDEQRAAHEVSLHDSVAPEDIGARFLARATDALSPFGGGSERRQGEESVDPRRDRDEVAESERRPSAAHAGVGR
jgi:hypothetical protein